MSQSAEALVEERVSQLQEIGKRRNELLREMYHLIQKRDHLGSMVAIEQDVDEGGDSLQLFLDRFNLEKHPETGCISSLREDEVALPETPPAYSPVGVPELETAAEPAPEPEREPEPETDSVVHANVDSPMSEPPASPPTAQRQEEEEEEEEEAAQLEDPHSSQMDISMDVDEDVSVPPTLVGEVLTKPEVSRIPSPEPMQAPKTEPEAELEPPSSPEEESRPTSLEVPDKSSTPALEPPPSRHYVASSQVSPVPHVSPVLTAATREPSTSRTLSPSPQRLLTHDSRYAHDEPSAIKAEPLDDEVMEVSKPEPQEPPPPPAQHVASQVPTGLAHRRITQEHSEDQIMAILRPSQPQSSPGPVDEDHTVVDYSIPLPTLGPSVQFSFDGVADELMDVEQHAAFTSRFGPDPPYPLPPLTLLPIEFSRKRSSKQRRRDKDKGESKKEEWQPVALNKWAAVLRANPVHPKLARASKCLSTRDWSVGITELRLIRVFERIEKLRSAGSWSFRQLKKQRGAGGLMKTHWDYLMDEMKWMRTDFREERRWKLALAHNLAHAVVAWHEAGSREERLRRGIVVLWQPPPPEDTEMADEGDPEQMEGPFRDTQDTDENGVESRETGTEGYASDDESDDEQDKVQQEVLDNLEPGAALQEALEQLEETSITPPDTQGGVTLEPKVEEIEDTAALGESASRREENAKEVYASTPDEKPGEAAVAKHSSSDPHSGLKPSSKNPVLGASGKNGDGSHGKKHKANQYAALRNHIVYSDLDKLFIDLDDLELIKNMSELSTDDKPTSPASTHPPPPHDFTAIFPDWQPYGLLDVAPSAQDGRKKDRKGDRDDPNKRAEDTTYSKLTPMSKFMFVRPTLVGTLKPASHFKNGRWSRIEETPVFADVEVLSARAVDENLCSLFEGTAARPNVPLGHPSLMPAPPRDVRKRNVDHQSDSVTWTPGEDALLKQAVDRYSNNWNLVADAFNSSRVTIPTDKRTPWECLERWREKSSAAAARADIAEDHTPSAASTSASASHMTTRGYKRSAGQSASASGSGSTNGAAPNEPRKRRRHIAIHDAIRKQAKKREQVQKSTTVPRSKPSAVHDTHGQFNKMPKLTPAELSRMKTEKEARDAHELTRRRNDELARQHLLREQSQQRAQALPPNAQQPATQQGQLLPQAANANSVPRPANGVQQAQMQQVRSQVGISQQQQQQRLAAALANANPNSRMSPPQLTAAQAAHFRALAHGQGQAQQQVQGQVNVNAAGQASVQGASQVPQVSTASAALSAAAPALSAAHLSPSFAARATSSSPGLPQQSPPLPAASPPNANASIAQPPSVPGQQLPGTPVNPLLQVPGNMSMATQYYLQGLQRSVTTEHLQALLAQHAPHVRQQLQTPHQQQPQYPLHPPPKPS